MKTKTNVLTHNQFHYRVMLSAQLSHDMKSWREDEREEKEKRTAQNGQSDSRRFAPR